MIHDSFPTHGNSKKPNLSEKRLAPVAQCKLQRRMLHLPQGCDFAQCMQKVSQSYL